MTTPAIDVEEATVEYLTMRDRPRTFKEFGIRSLLGRMRHERLVALRSVSFRVPRGEVFGIIGANGAGKSTLVKLVARILPPTSGRVRVWGKVAPLVELGAGLEMELTGRENIELYGALLGGESRALRARAAAIAEWAGVGEFLDVPLRSYSTGMIARLAVGVATSCEPDVVLLDEVLSVGDEAFRARCAERMETLMARGATVVIVSHDLETLAATCQRMLWLDGGVARACGEPREIVQAYRQHLDSLGEAALVVPMTSGPAAPPRRRVLLPGAPRSGNVWAKYLLNGACGLEQREWFTPGEVPWDALPGRCVLQLPWRPTDSLREHVARHQFDVVVMARHPLDVLISVLHFAPFEPTTRRWLDGEGGSEDEIWGASPGSPAFLRYACGPRAAALLAVTREWWQVPGVVRLRYEDVARDASSELHRVTAALGEPLEPSTARTVTEANHIDNLRPTAANRHFWMGRSGLWRSLLPPEAARRIASAHEAHFRSLGYECDPDPHLDAAQAEANWLAVR